MAPRLVASEADARDLARRLNSGARTKPVVVVSTPAQRPTPYIDADRIVEQVGDLAEVYLIRTGTVSWEFSRAMPDLTQVYGGAGRVYPVGTAWVRHPYTSPLRFAWGAEEGAEATDLLVADALRMAFEAGLLRRTPAQRRRVGGVVQQLVQPSRALVRTDDSRVASIWQELLFPDVRIDRALATGMRVDGVLDLESMRYDVRDMALPVDEAMAGYRAGMVVLAEVVDVADETATLRLHPEVRVTVRRDEVTSNDLDLLSSLMTPSEVLAVRVLEGAPGWRVSMLDVEDDEVPAVAPPLLRGGPPWLVPPVAERVPPVEEAPPAFVVPDTELEPAVEAVSEALPTDTPPREPTPAVRPTPLMLDPKRRGAIAEAAAAATREIEHALSARKRVEDENARLRRQLVDLGNERQLLHNELEKAKARVRALDVQLKQSRSGLRRARQKAERADRTAKEQRVLFLRAEEQLRHDVRVAWAERIPAADKAHHPLGEYVIGPAFMQSLDEVPGVDRSKVVDVVVEVVTGLADILPGREMHPLRTGPGGDDPPIRRGDGARCWRVALQSNAPAARRLHFWRLGDGTVELSRVCLHDDFTP